MSGLFYFWELGIVILLVGAQVLLIIIAICIFLYIIMLLFLPTLFLFDVNLRLNCRRSLSFDVTLPPPSRQCYPNVTSMLLFRPTLFLFDVTLPPPSRSMLLLCYLNVTLMLPQCYSFVPRYFSLMLLFLLPHVQC